MYEERFETAKKFAAEEAQRNTIGRLAERQLHLVLKYFFEPNTENHEKKTEGYVADIKNEYGITEIQTRSLYRLEKKLNAFLESERVTVVYPIAHIKKIVWAERESGELTKARKSPKIGRYIDAIGELYGLKKLLNDEKLRICLVLVDLTEYVIPGKYKNKRFLSERIERIPEAVFDYVYLEKPQDYLRLLPEKILFSEGFTTAELSAEAKINKRLAGLTANLLYSIGALEKTGKRGNSILYKIK